MKRLGMGRAWLWVSLGLLICLVGAFILWHDYPSQVELSGVFANYLRVVQDAELNTDVSLLGTVVVSPHIELVVESIEGGKDDVELGGEEFRNVLVNRIDEYTPAKATANVQYDYRQFAQDRNTGERRYGPSGHWYWRIVKVHFIKQGGLWKVSEIYFVDWSG